MWRAPTERHDPAQMILVGALALAVVLVGIALVLNSAIYAENLATRANQEAPAQISSLQQESVDGTAQAMDHHHHNASSHASYSELETRLEESIRDWSALQLRDSAREGRYVDASITNIQRGTRIAQTDGTEFVPQDTNLLGDVVDLAAVSSWAVTPTDTRVRDFTMTVERDEIGADSLYEESTVVSEIDALLENNLDTDAVPYTILYDVGDDDTYEHAVSIYRTDGDADDVKITHRDESGTATTCEIEDAPAVFEIDISGGTVEGGDGSCADVFDFQSEISNSYQLIFVEGEEMEGDYEFVVDDDTGTFEDQYEDGLLASLLTCTIGDDSCFDFESYYEDHTSHDATYSPPSGPYVEPAIYSTDVSITYQSDQVSADSTIRVAPNEP